MAGQLACEEVLLQVITFNDLSKPEVNQEKFDG